MIKAIFWDNDGVLVDTERLYFQATRTILQKQGFDLTQADFVELLMVQGRGPWHVLAEKGVSPMAIERLREERNDLYSRLLTGPDLLIDGVEATLRSLAGKYRMGIVTSSRKDHFELIHRDAGILPFFEFVLTAGDYTASKPDPEPYLRALERTGLPREECLVVEDSRRGLTAALAAGIRCAIVPNAMTRGSNFTGAYAVLERVADVVELLDHALEPI